MKSLPQRAGEPASLLLLAVVGPGFITANVDNDAGGIFTYSLAGAQFGYSLLWTMIPITIALVVVQEMAARMGAVTGKGLSDLIREEFGFRVTFFLMIALVVTNFGNVVAEFAGVASSLELFGVSKYIVVPRRGVRRLGARRPGHLRQRREDLPGRVGFYVCYIVAGLLAHPDWKAAALATVTPARRASASATTATCTWSSAWSARRSRRGCSSTCRRRSSRRASPPGSTGRRGGT